MNGNSSQKAEIKDFIKNQKKIKKKSNQKIKRKKNQIESSKKNQKIIKTKTKNNQKKSKNNPPGCFAGSVSGSVSRSYLGRSSKTQNAKNLER